MFLKASSQKQQAYDFYNSYEWEKVTWPTFYQRVRNGWDESREDKIVPKQRKQYHREERTPKGKRAEQMTRYSEQPEPKASKTLFRNRLNSGYPKEEAILMWDKWISAKEKKKKEHPQYNKTYIPKWTAQKEPDEETFKIDITYPKDVARVFRKEYQRIIDELERKLTMIDEKTLVKEANDKLEFVKAELEAFNLLNPQ